VLCPGNGPHSLGPVSIDDWVAKYVRDTFAVCVMSSSNGVQGVILQRTGLEDGSLVRIGIFEVEENEDIIQLPEACHLDWTVL
jgi:hypothetical protein